MLASNMSIPSVMKHDFSRVPAAEIQRSSFNRSHGHKTTFNCGELIPIFLDEVLPGDTFNLKLTAFARLATLSKPIMDNLFMDTQFFFVPTRLIWDNWQRFNGEQDDPGDSTDYLVPQVPTPASTGWTYNSIGAYFGVRMGIAGKNHNALPYRAHNLIYNEWYRDQNLQDSLTVPKGDGPDTAATYGIYRRGKRHDYFTSCLPWPQKGPAVPLPLTGNAPVIGIGTAATSPTYTSTANIRFTGDSAPATRTVSLSNTDVFAILQDPANAGYPGVYADLSDVTATTINALRTSFQIQRLYERDARGGTRYTEILRAHFGVVSPDARLQRPEFLGGGSTPMNVMAVPQTTPASGGSTPQANLSAYATGHLRGHGFTKSFVEHGYIIGYVSVRADLNYQQGLNRMFSRSTRWDFYWPALAHIGEQAVLNQEIFLQGTADDLLTFGYQERFAEYRYKPSLITGAFNSDYATSLDVWHLAQDFASLPLLNSTFIQENPPVTRVIAVPSEPQILFDGYFQLTCARPMPVYSVPGLIDHF